MLKLIVAAQFGVGAVVSIWAAASIWHMPGALFAFGITQMFCAFLLLQDRSK